MPSPLRFFPIFILTFCAGASAQNVVVNPDLDLDIASWTPNAAAVGRDASHNLVGRTASGSMSVINDVGKGSTAGAVQCINGPFAPGQYDVGGWILLPAGQAGSGSAAIAVGVYSAADCTGDALASVDASKLPDAGWSLVTQRIAVPADAASVLVNARIDTAANTSPPVQAWFDGIRFGPAPTVPSELHASR